MPYAAGLSEHPVTAVAIGELAGHALERLGPEPDVVFLFVSPHHAGALEDAARAVRSVLRPRALVGCVAGTVAANRREAEGAAALSLWAGRLGPVVSFALDVTDTPDGPALLGWPEDPPFAPSAAIVIGDPFTFPPDALFAAAGGIPVIGGMASGAHHPGGTYLALDDRILRSGAVGVLVGPEVEVDTVVSQGCRPIGDPYVITRAERNVIHEMGGRSPLDRLQDIATDPANEGVARLINNGLHVGIAIDEHKVDLGRGDFLVRNVIGGDRATGAIAIGDLVEVGTTAQFHVRDAVTAEEDLRAMLAGRRADGALLFTCNGRGRHLFGVPDHDATVLADALDDVPSAGFLAAGELGPVGGRNFLHGFTASIGLFRDVGRVSA